MRRAVAGVGGRDVASPGSCSPRRPSPRPPAPAPAGGDPRSSGQGPGLVGDPLFALLAVVAIGVLSVVATLVYVRLTGGPRHA